MTNQATGTDERGNERLRAGVAPSRPLWSRLSALSLWVLLWQLASMLVGSSILLAGPFETLLRLAQLLVQPQFLRIVCFSTLRIVGGFLVAYAAAVVLALAAHRWPLVGELCSPAVLALKSVPIACVTVLLLMWVGSRAVSGPAVFLAIFPAVYFSCAEGLANVDRKVGEMLSSFHAGSLVRLFSHVWPQTLPHLVGASKNVCGMAWKSGIAAELIGSPMGSIGERIYQSKVLLETADLFAWTIVVVALSALCERCFVALLARSDRLSRAIALALVRGRASRPGSPSMPPAAEMALDHATIGYEDKVVARDLSTRFAPGSRTVLVDASGMGKTTLLRTVSGLQDVLGGGVRKAPTVAMVFQEARLIEPMTAEQNVLLVADGSLGMGEIRDMLLELLPEDALGMPVSSLSGGQRRRVEIVRAMAHPSSAVILDEPFASLDERTHRDAAEFVSRHLSGRTLLVASHAREDAELLDAQPIELFATGLGAC
jgi:NitT/TauT family transport system permease protein